MEILLLFDATVGGVVTSRIVKVNVSASLNTPSKTVIVIVDVPLQLETGEMVNVLPVSTKDTLGSGVMASYISTSFSASVADRAMVLDVLLAEYCSSTF